MEKLSVVAARAADAVGKQALVQGWIRTRRDSKGGFSFLEINDGSCLGNLQAIADADLPNYESDIKRLTTGCSVTIEGEVKESGGKQATDEVWEGAEGLEWTVPSPAPYHTFATAPEVK